MTRKQTGTKKTAMRVALLAASMLAGAGSLAISAVVAVWGLAFGVIPIAITVWMFKAEPDYPEAGQALLVSVVQIALSSGALIGGRIVDNFGLPATMTFGGVLCLIAAAVVLVFVRAPWPAGR